MEMSRASKLLIGFMVTTIILVVYDVVGMYGNPAWEKALPMGVVDHTMPFFVNVVVPLVAVLVGYAIALLLSDRRAGQAIALGVGIGNIVLNVPVTILRLEAGFPYGAAICGIEVAVGIITIVIALNALRVPAATRRTVASGA
jgi:cytochrome c biogenesis factor